MSELTNEQINRIYYLSAVASYPLCDRLYAMTGDVGTIETLLGELEVLLSAEEIDTAYLLFQFLMAIAEMEIIPEIRIISSYHAALRHFMHEFFLDLKDYYDQIPLSYGCEEEEFMI